MTYRVSLTAATLALTLGALPALAQDAPPKTAPKTQPRTRAPAPAPKTPAAEPAPAESGAPEGGGEAPPSDPADPPSDDAAERDAADASTAHEPPDAPETNDTAPEDAVSPETAADEGSTAKGHPAKTKAPQQRPPAKSERRGHRRSVPQASAAMKSRQAPRELEYIDGVEVPEGYVKVERMRSGLVIAGAVTFGVGWLAAATAAVSQVGEGGSCRGWGHRDDEDYGIQDYEDPLGCTRGTDAEDFAPLYIPIAGPFIAMGTLEHADGAVRAALLLDGVVQVGGAAMFVAGLVAKKTLLVRTPEASVSLVAGPGTLGLQGSF